eukprot:3884466-Amphidinium_carterae.1
MVARRGLFHFTTGIPMLALLSEPCPEVLCTVDAELYSSGSHGLHKHVGDRWSTLGFGQGAALHQQIEQNL